MSERDDQTRSPWTSGLHDRRLSRVLAVLAHPATEEAEVRALVGRLPDTDVVRLRVATRRPATPYLRARLDRAHDLAGEELRRRLRSDLAWRRPGRGPGT